MLSLLLILLGILLPSCTTTSDQLPADNSQPILVSTETQRPLKMETLPEHEKNEITGTVLSTNSYVRSQYSKTHKKDFSSFTINSYKSILDSSNAKMPERMKKIFKKLENIHIRPTNSGYIFCASSNSPKFTFCDDTLCQKVEYFYGENEPALISKWDKELPLKSCPEVN